jgi:N-acetylglucosamine-6-sulfatase
VPAGWDLWYAFTEPRYYDYTINENGKLLNFGHEPADYSTDVLKNRAVRFIKDQAGSSTPFFMLIATKAPHGQGEEGQMGLAIPSPAYAQAFSETKLPTTPAFNEADVSDKPHKVAKSPALDEVAKNKIEASYRAELQSLQSVDDLVGGVVDELRSTGRLNNTVIIYTSDNGFEFGDHRLLGKNSVYEPSIRVPLVMKGPDIPQNETRNQLVNNLDLVATIEEIAGLAPNVVPDGRSLMPVLRDGKAPWRSAILVEGGVDVSSNSSRYAAVRTATRKYVQHEDGFEELYDLLVDPYELENKAHDPAMQAILRPFAGSRIGSKSAWGVAVGSLEYKFVKVHYWHLGDSGVSATWSVTSSRRTSGGDAERKPARSICLGLHQWPQCPLLALRRHSE